MWKVPLFNLSYDDREERAVQEVLHSKWLTMGPKTKEFEDAFSGYLGGGVTSCAVSSCTAALHLALLALGIGAGDEVVVPALTFVAALNVVRLVGATPVLADSASKTDWNMSAATIERSITPRTKAVIIVHFAGYPCDMEAIMAVTGKAGIPVVEDCAHAIGSSHRGRMCGTFGALACFSFFSNKNLSTGEGGMIVTGSAPLAERVRLLRSHGMTSLTIERHQGKSIGYDVVRSGLNYRSDEIHSALGLVQLGKLDAMNASRHQVAKLYRELLAGPADLVIPWPDDDPASVSCHHIFPVLLPGTVRRDQVVGHLSAAGIQTSIHYPSFAGFSAFQHLGLGTPAVAGEISARVLTLPLFPAMTGAEVALVVQALGQALAA